MNTKLLWGLVVIIIIAGGAYFYMKGGGVMPGSAATTTPSGAQAGASGLKSLSDLVYAAKPVSCNISTHNGAATTNGTVYIGAAMMRGDFTLNDPSVGTVSSHMIVRDNTSYVWTDTSKQGFKSAASASQTASSTQGVNYNTPQDYNCQPWTTDLSKFNLPGDVSFVAAASYVPPSQGAGATGASSNTQGTAAQCGQCNSLPAAQKAQCIAALHC